MFFFSLEASLSKEKKQHASLFIFELDKRINVFLVFRRELPALPALFMNTARKGKISSLFGIGCEPQGTRLTERHQVMGEQLTATGFSPSYTALLLAVGGEDNKDQRERESPSGIENDSHFLLYSGGNCL